MSRALPIAKVVVNLPLERAFDYAVPAALNEIARVGSRVRVPLGVRRVTGVIVQRAARSPLAQVRELVSVLDPQPLYTPELLRLGQWVAQRYYCAWGEALVAMAPPVTRGPRVARWDGPQPQETSPVRLPTSYPLDAVMPRALAKALAQPTQTLVVRLAPAVVPWEWLGALLSTLPPTAYPVLVLVPEVSYVEHLRSLWQTTVGERAVFVHHQLGVAARRTAWSRLLGQDVPLVIGTRSAVFAPLRRFGVMVLMEEHDHSYKQDGVPHYHAREVALERARRSGAVTLLVSATPSLEAWHAVRQSRAQLVEVTGPSTSRTDIQLIDLRSHQGATHRNPPLFAPPLARALESVATHDQRALLLFNRVGFASRVQCDKCGEVLQCAACSTALTYVSRTRMLRCRWCGSDTKAPELCPRCQGDYLRYRGLGVEKVHSELARRFPTLQLLRVTRADVGRRPTRDHWLTPPQAPTWQVLVGTEAVLHGWPLPPVSLIGILASDLLVTGTDFRSAERLIQHYMRALQCLQWAGGGRLFLQTRNPTYIPLLRFAQQQLDQWSRQELRLRRQFHLPPWTHVIAVTLRARRAPTVEQNAGALAEAFRAARHPRGLSLLGPAPLAPVKRRGEYHWHVVLRGQRFAALLRWLRTVLGGSRRWQGSAVTVDVDPC